VTAIATIGGIAAQGSERGKSRIRSIASSTASKKSRGALSRPHRPARRYQHPPHLQIDGIHRFLPGFGAVERLPHAADSPDITLRARLFQRPRGLDFSGFSVSASSRLARSSRDTGAFGDGQRQGLSKKFLRSGRHVAILDAAGQPNKRLHQTAACFFVQPLVSRDRLCGR
jgi:hypothetical protein